MVWHCSMKNVSTLATYTFEYFESCVAVATISHTRPLYDSSVFRYPYIFPYTGALKHTKVSIKTDFFVAA